jgi:hypothetical protein
VVDQPSTDSDSDAVAAAASAPVDGGSGPSPVAVLVGLFTAIVLGGAFTLWRAQVLTARLRGLAWLRLVLGMIRIW